MCSRIQFLGLSHRLQSDRRCNTCPRCSHWRAIKYNFLAGRGLTPLSQIHFSFSRPFTPKYGYNSRLHLRTTSATGWRVCSTRFPLCTVQFSARYTENSQSYSGNQVKNAKNEGRQLITRLQRDLLYDIDVVSLCFFVLFPETRRSSQRTSKTAQKSQS